MQWDQWVSLAEVQVRHASVPRCLWQPESMKARLRSRSFWMLGRLWMPGVQGCHCLFSAESW